jgi:hypothetical protein
MTPPADPEFAIHYAPRLAERLRELTDRAVAAGLRDEIIADLRLIDRRLRSDPLSWGDLWYRYSYLNLLMCHATAGLLHVYYGVDEERRVVYLKDVTPLPHGPLDLA